MNALTSFQTPLEKIFHSNGKLNELIRKSAALKKIETLVHSQLAEILVTSIAENSVSAELLRAIQVLNFEKGRLQLSCQNAAISTRLRYLLPELIHKLRAGQYLPNLITIELKIAQTTSSLVAPSSPQTSRLSPASSALLKNLLASLKR